MPDIEILSEEPFTVKDETGTYRTKILVNVRNSLGLIETLEFPADKFTQQTKQDLIRKELEQRTKSK